MCFGIIGVSHVLNYALSGRMDTYIRRCVYILVDLYRHELGLHIHASISR